MRIHAHFRIREHLRDFIKKVRRLSVTVLVLLILFGGVIVGKNIFLSGLEKEIRKYIAYSDLRVSYFPPALTLDDVRSIVSPPVFQVRHVRVEIPFVYLLRSQKSINVFLDQPEIRLTADIFRPRKTKVPTSLPFTVARGLVQDGTVSYESEGTRVEVRRLRALFTGRGDEFNVRAVSEEAEFVSLPGKTEIGGTLNISFSGKGDAVKIQRFTIEGKNFVAKAEGTLRKFRAPEYEFSTRFETEMAAVGPLIDLPFPIVGRVQGQGTVKGKPGDLSFRSDIAGDRLTMDGVPLGRIKGTLAVSTRDGGKLSIEMQKNGRPAESLAIVFKGGRADGQVRGVFADPLMKDIQVPWPVKSPAWGSFAVENGIVNAEVEFRDTDMRRDGNLFPFRGPVTVVYNTTTQGLEISAPDLQSSFARLEARTSLRIGGTIDSEIRGTILDIKEGREFLSLALNEPFDFPEIRGGGYADVHLTGRTDNPRVAFKGSFTPAGFDLFNAAFAEGEGVIFADTFEAKFHVDDPDLKGDLHVLVTPKETQADFQKAEADLAKVFEGLQIPLPLHGRGSGDFKLVQTLTSQDVTGSFSVPELTGYGLKAQAVSGELEWKDGTLSFPKLGLSIYGGRIEGRVLLGLASRNLDADLHAENIDLSQLTPTAKGGLSFSLTGAGNFAKDRLTGRFAVQNLMIPLIQKAEVDGSFSVGYAENAIGLDVDASFKPGDNQVQGHFEVPLGRDAITGSIKGHWTNLDLILPWTGAKGRLDATIDLSGPQASPNILGTVAIQGAVMPFPRFAQAATDYSATARIENKHIFISELKAKFGGGDVQGSGDIGLGVSGVETIDANFTAKDVQFTALERTRALLDGQARLLKDSRQFVLDGDFLVKRLLWRRELYERFGFSSEAVFTPNREPGFFDNLNLNLRLHAPGNAVVENSLGMVTVRFDLSLTGNINDPLLLGDIEMLRGTLNFQDTAFKIVSGRVSFLNPGATEPYLEIRAETYVKDYRVTLNLVGSPSRLKPEFTSSPPMSSDDILALLALGEAFRPTYTYSPERSSTLSTASLLSFQIAEQAKKRAQGLFTLDRFRIDPFVTSTTSETTARLTLGKKLSRNLLFIYSTNLAAQREEIYRVEWDLGPDFSLVGLRNELGRLSLDLRYRKRF